jgi:hypothetical protein
VRLSVNMNAGSYVKYLVISVRTWCIAVNSARRMFWRPGSLAETSICFIGL